MSQNLPTPANETDWKTRIYLTGAMLGTLFGLIAAYLFNRAAEENEDRRPPKVPTSQILALTLAVLGLARQIAELGKDKKK